MNYNDNECGVIQIDMPYKLTPFLIIVTIKKARQSMLNYPMNSLIVRRHSLSNAYKPKLCTHHITHTLLFGDLLFAIVIVINKLLCLSEYVSV